MMKARLQPLRIAQADQLGTLLNENAAWLKRMSPFEQFSPANALALENDTLITLGVYFGLLVAFITVGLLIYRRRDFNV